MQPPPMAPPPMAPPAQDSSAGLTVAGVQNATVGNIVRGSYTPYSENHSRIVYRKNEQVNGLDVLVYYWDERDGPSFCGWWFGPKVGGDQVWAYTSQQTQLPPQTGWKVPYDGPVDPTFLVTGMPATAKRHADAGSPYSQPAQKQARADEYGYSASASDRDRYGQPGQPQAASYGQPPSPAYGQSGPPQQRYDSGGYQKEQDYRAMDHSRQREMDRQRAEQESRYRQEEQRRRQMEDEKRRMETQACLVARKAIQNLRLATPENYEQVRREVDDSVYQELPRCGSQAELVRDELDKVIQQTLHRIEGIKEQRRRDEEHRREEARLRKEHEETARQLLQELAQLVETAVKDGERLKEVAAPASQPDMDTTPEEVRKLVSSVSEVAASAKASCKACNDFIVTNRSALEQAKFVWNETKAELLRWQSQIQDCLRQIISLTLRAKSVQTRMVRKATAVKVIAKRSATFDKYDKDNDGELNKKEVLAYAMSEFSFAIPKDALPKIFQQLESANGGIPKAKFHQLKMAVGITREGEASRSRREEAERRRQMLEARKKELQRSVDAASEALDDVEPEVAKAEERVTPLAGSIPESMAAAEAQKCIENTQDQHTAAKNEADAVAKQRSRLLENVEQELLPFITAEVRKLDARAALFDERLGRVAAAMQRGRDHVARLELIELERLSAEASKLMKAYAKKENLSLEDFFAAVDKDGDGVISQAEFLALFGRLEGCELSHEKLTKLFAHFDQKGSGSMSKESFLKLVRVFYHVVSETVMTTEMSIKEGRTIRRLEQGEVIEIQEGPAKDDGLDVTRIKGRAMRDDSVGWATLVGNNGNVFLEEGGPDFVVVLETALTAGFALSGSETLRLLREGTVLEVLEWDKREEQSGSVRLRVRVKGEAGVEGWVTKVSSDGTIVLKVFVPV